MESKHCRIFIAIIALLAGVLVKSGWLDSRGYEYTQAGLQRALVTFGISRSLNGVISVAQGTEVAVEPVGVGMTFTPGEILDPVNDLIERFSTVVLVAGTAFGAQQILLNVTVSDFYAWLFWASLSAVLLSLLMWQKLAVPIKLMIFRCAVIVVFLRLAVPFFAITGELFYQHFLEPQYQESSNKLKFTTERLTVLNEESKVVTAEKLEERSFLESAKEWVQSAGTALDWKTHLAEFTDAAEAASEHAIRLMVVFVFQTILLPLLALWITVRVSRVCVTSRYSCS